MSKTSGADPITREQVERALGAAGTQAWDVLHEELGIGWTARAPQYVRDAWGCWGDCPELESALTCWRDELAAAEPVRRVARWDGESHWELSPAHTLSNMTVVTACDRAQAIAWGYTIEGGPEPVQSLSRCPDCGGPRTNMDEHDAWCDDCWGKRCAVHYVATEPAEDSPERLRERREALGLSRRDMANLVLHRSICMDNVPEYANCWHPEDVRRCEEVPDAPAIYAQHRARYAAALSAEESRRAALASGRRIGKSINTAQQFSEEPHDWGDESERPAPRFKVGDWVRVVSNGTVYQVGEIATPFGGNAYYFRETGGAENSWQAAALEPASPPAPEVVDVPQPVVKRVSGVMVDGRDEDQYALWVRGESVIALTFVRNDSADSHEIVSVALLRAMLEAIDAQQGGAS